MALSSARISYLSLSNMIPFLLNPWTYLFFIILFLAMSILMSFSDGFLKEFFYLKISNQPIHGLKIILSSVSKTIQSFTLRNIRNTMFIWLRMISYNLPFLIITLRYNRFLQYLSAESSPALLWGLMLILYVISVYFINYKEIPRIKNHVIFNIFQTLVIFVIYMIVIVTVMFSVYILVDRMVAVAAFIAVFERVNRSFTLLILIVSTTLHYARYVILSYSSRSADHFDLQPHTSENVSFVRKKQSNMLIMIVLMMLLTADIFISIGIIRNGSMIQAASFDQITITSHRGYSYSYPENTLIAIERAIEVYSDYVEVDVRVTQDNQFVLLHDDNLMRTTGVNRSIARTSLEDVLALDAGRWKSIRFEGTRIPTLKETLEFVKGKAGLNLDLKLSESQSYLMSDLVALIDEFGMQYQVLITSTCLSCLMAIKDINPNIRTGYITYGLTETLLANESVDVISMRSSFVTLDIVRRVHQANKKILVWTVNSRLEIERMSSLGVNNIITDRPFYAKEVLFKFTGDPLLVTLLRIIMNV